MKILPFHYLSFIPIFFVAVCVADEKATPVTATPVFLAPFNSEIPLTGNVFARRRSMLSAKTDGFVMKMFVDEGYQVKKGDPLLELDAKLTKIELAKAKAEVDEAFFEMTEAQRQKDEAAELVEKKHISETTYESLSADVKIKAAILEQLRADLKTREEVLRRHTINAPFDGVIVAKEVEEGHWIETGTTLFELLQTNIVRINVPTPQYYFSRIQVGTLASIHFDAYPELEIEARVLRKIPAADATARTFPVRFELKNEEHLLAPGMSARVRFKFKDKNEVKLLPRDAIVRKPDGSESVWLISESDAALRVRSVKVQTGRSSRGTIEIISNQLQAGDRVVLKGNELLREDQLIKIANTKGSIQ